MHDSLSPREDLEYEIVVSDNGSTDRSVEIAESLGARIVHAETRGYGAALQAGIAGAKGTYVMFADADSTYLTALRSGWRDRITEAFRALPDVSWDASP